ncbi:hypothetical protein LTR37_018026 [Vermiconidia calcicola]|uniref:Uncharacterized protein n=1 Tax=Vermiconidia calcicola TaxID=1690605 RepID=A0ACC3MIC4_9PEZI|nr:hypothetical protein LTR37_018026 [Vermiconidia calcicola]
MANFAGLPKDWIVTSGQFTRNTFTDFYPAVDPTKSENSLTGKTVVVTGASRGLGAYGIAPAFVKAGVKAQLKKINTSVGTFTLAADISCKDAVTVAWTTIHTRYPRIDILVKNAGVESSDSDKTHEQDPDVFFKYFLQRMGRIPFLAAYANSKAAIIQYTTAVAASYPSTVLAIAVNPGLNDTEIIPASLRQANFNFNEPALTGATMVWLVADPGRSFFLSGRVLTVEWDVEELIARKEEITKQNLLTMSLHATLGAEQFAR